MLNTRITILFFFSICWGGLLAQNYEDDGFYIQIGVGVPTSSFFQEDHRMLLPLFNLSLEKAITDQITVGGTLGFTASRSTVYRFQGDHFFYRNNFSVLMLRGAYHPELFDEDKFDVYGGTEIGVRVGWAAYYGQGELAELEVNPGTAPWGLAYRVFAGGHYYHSDFLHFFLEVGFGASLLNLGLQFNL